MSVTVTRTANAALSSERWTNFRSDFLANWDSYLAICRLGANDSEKWGSVFDFRFSIPADATIIDVTAAVHWWGSNAGSYMMASSSTGGTVHDDGAVSGRWAQLGCFPEPTAAQINSTSFTIAVHAGRTTGAAVNVYIDQLTVSVTYEPAYVPPPPPPTYAPTVVTTGVSGVLSNSATGSATITSDGGAGIQDHGFCVHQWPGSGEGTVGVGGGAVEAYTLPLANLIPSTLYYVRAYAGNANGYGYGADWAFYAAPQEAGDGGPGIVSSLSGQSAGYAGGGGGGMLGVGTPGSASCGGGLGGNQHSGYGGSGIPNTGGGGGGAGTGGYGGDGGKGVVVIRYKTADAVATSPSLSTSIFRPSIAYRGGRLFAPYSKGEDAKILTITGNTVAAATVISTAFPSGNIVPQMTSATAPSGVASDGGHLSSYAAWMTFDHINPEGGNTGTWLSDAGTGWLQYEFPSASAIMRYAVTLRNQAAPHVYAPKTWTFKGSNNGSTWTTLDTQTNVTDWATTPNARRVFSFANTTAYAYYRLDITASNGGYVGVGELEMMEADTASGHGILPDKAQVVTIVGSNSTPSIDGSHIATRVSNTTFSIPVNVTTAGTEGLILYNHSVGWALTSGGYKDVGWLTQSPTTFHTGSMKKDFRYVSVSHDVLPDGATVRPMSWLIDGVYGTSNGVAYSPQETRYALDQQGYSIETTLGMTPDYTGSVSPVVRGVNVIWNFVKNKKHTYSLDCRSGAEAGRWNENPEAALKFLYATANERASFEDRFAGVYQGAIESVEFTPAPISPSEGPSGIAKIVVREEQ